MSEPVTRELTFAQAVNEATDLCMAADRRVYLMGLGVPDVKGVFGTTSGLQQKYGSERVLDMPTSENGMTGVAIGSACVGARPIMVHQRIEFALLAIDQIINQAANWHYMFGGQDAMPIVIRMLIGRGWGQGPQHSQSLQAMFGHVPGLKVVMPVTPHDAKGLLIAAVEDNNPVIYLEHRWLHSIRGPVPEGAYRVPIGEARTARSGKDVTIVSVSYATLEALRAAELLERDGIEAEVIDVRSIRPIDTKQILESVRRTGRLVVVDAAWSTMGFSAEVLALAAESAHGALKNAPLRVTLPDVPSPSTRALTADYYPRAIHVVNGIRSMLSLPPQTEEQLGIQRATPSDIPDQTFVGPF
jgi:pyruvate dehydrogenase E1 component beta subunit